MSKVPGPRRRSGRPAGSPLESSPVDSLGLRPSIALEMRDSPGPAAFPNMKTADIRAAFLIEDLFVPGELKLFCWNIDRAVIGAAVPRSLSEN